MVESTSIEALKERINRRPGESLDYFYRDEDRQAGKFDDNRLAVRMHQVVGKPAPFESFEKLRGYLMQLVKGG